MPYFGTSISACQQLVHFFSFFGVPKQIVSDEGTEFQNDVVKELLKSHKITIHFTTPYHHESNGPVERFHSTITEHLRLLREQDKDGDVLSLMPYAIIAYNSTNHSSTGYSPHELVLGHTNSRDPMALIPAQAYTQYINSHENNTKAIYTKVHEESQNVKEKVINRVNETKKTLKS